MSSSNSQQLALGLLIVIVGMLAMVTLVSSAAQHNYADALSKSILFFEGQRSGRLPPTQRMTWRKNSALRDGLDVKVSLFNSSLSNSHLICLVFKINGSISMDLLILVEILSFDLRYLFDLIDFDFIHHEY